MERSGFRTNLGRRGHRDRSIFIPEDQRDPVGWLRKTAGPKCAGDAEDSKMFCCRRRILFFALGALLAGSVAAIECQTPDNGGALKLNQIQVIGTHNSYHAGIAPSESKLWKVRVLSAWEGLDYKHEPLTQQLDSGVRQIELDIFADSKGGRYAHPAGPQMVAAAHLPPDPEFDPDGVMMKPGFKVMHVQDIDYRSVCQPFTACLDEVRQWSHAHPSHIPIFILVETKQESTHGPMHLTEAEPFTRTPSTLWTPRSAQCFRLKKSLRPTTCAELYDTLNEAVLAGNWPTLTSARGKVIFLMDQRPVGPVYLDGHPSLRGRVLFTNAAPGQPDAAFTECNDGPASEISDLVRQGYLVPRKNRLRHQGGPRRRYVKARRHDDRAGRRF